jgi:hypothetical protein
VRPGETTIHSLDEARLERWIEESLGPRAASRPRGVGARGTA